jgi:CubicO group peptidase (beta-lactamase class C family)
MKKIVVLLLCVCSFGFAQEVSFDKLDEFLEVLSNNDKIMGSLSIMKDGDEVYNKSVGYQYLNYKSKNLASQQTKYKIGSITKTFTATMIFQLMEEGKITLDTKLSKYFALVPNASKITISNLLTHSSGLYNLTNAEAFGTWKDKPTTSEEMLSRILKFDPDFEPGEKHSYSNTNFLLLGYIIENIDKRSYAESLKLRITDKLGLKNTYCGGDVDINANESHSYNYSGNIWQQSPETHMSLPGGAGAITSNASDLVVFMDALFNHQLISAESLKVMTTEERDDFCKGIFKNSVEGEIIFGHDGGIDGFQSMLVYIPQAKTVIALTANALNYSKMNIMINAFKTSVGMDIDAPNFSKIELTEMDVKEYVGVYESKETPYDLVFEANGKVLKGAPEGSNLKDLIPTKKDEFTFDALGIQLNFNTDDETVLFKRADNKPVLFTRKL